MEYLAAKPPKTPEEMGPSNQSDQYAKRLRNGSHLTRIRELILIPPLILLILLGSQINDSFLTANNMANILGASAALAILVLAESLILISGFFDLSLEATAAIAPAIAALTLLPPDMAGLGTEWPLGVAIALMVCIGAAIGALNGYLIVRLGLNAFIVTLAMLIVLRGTLMGITNSRTLFGMQEGFFVLANVDLLGLPLSVWLAGSAFAVAGVMLRYHRLGRALYAIGGNAEASRLSGIRVDRIRMGVFIIGGILASLAGLILTGYVGAIPPNLAEGMIFTVFAAAVVGGISLQGGKGTMFGALTGVLLLAVVQNLLILAQVPSYWIQAVYGVIILLALIGSRLTGGRTQN